MIFRQRAGLLLFLIGLFTVDQAMDIPGPDTWMVLISMGLIVVGGWMTLGD